MKDKMMTNSVPLEQSPSSSPSPLLGHWLNMMPSSPSTSFFDVSVKMELHGSMQQHGDVNDDDDDDNDDDNGNGNGLGKFNEQENWLPITESRKGNAFYAGFHTLNSGIGFQALLLPLALATLGWVWGIICLSLAFIWQLYTLWLLIQLHEAENGVRHSRYLRLSIATFGEKLGKVLCLFPTMYLSGGTCVALLMVAGNTLKLFFNTVCDSTCTVKPLTTMEWYIIFTGCAVIIAQLPNLNSIAGVSLIGGVTAIVYCTLLWVVSVVKARPMGLSYESINTVPSQTEAARVCSILNALGMIVFAFRGHNLTLEIQGTMPTTTKQPSRVAMWRGVRGAYLVIALCLFPLAIVGHWAYGNLIPKNEGILNALYIYHRHDTSKSLLAFICLLVVINCLTSFEIYAMPFFDNLEFRYTSRMKKPCPRWVRSAIRAFFGCLVIFIAFSLPFLPSLASLLGGIALPITLAYPCLMWLKIKKPSKYSPMWFLNWALGCIGILLSILLVAGAIWSIVIMGMKVHFFRPQ